MTDLAEKIVDAHRHLAAADLPHAFAGETIPCIACVDVAVFKTFFNRTKYRADIEAMQAAGTLDTARGIQIISEDPSPDDERVVELRKFLA